MNIFVVVGCQHRNVILVTTSARKAKKLLKKGVRVDIWSNNEYVDTIYFKQVDKFNPYVMYEKQYIGEKQRQAEERNRRRNHSK